MHLIVTKFNKLRIYKKPINTNTMGKVKEMKREIEGMLYDIYSAIGMDKPENHEQILDFITYDVQETADPENWHSGDVGIAFRRWIEAQATQPDENPKPNIWGEIRNDFEDNGIVHIDAWVTADDNEEGTVIAKVNVRTKEVEYLDDRAKTDEYAQEIINETLTF